MPRHRPVSTLTLTLADGREPLRRRIAAAIVTALRDGSLGAGDPLPSSRALAADLGVARGAARLRKRTEQVSTPLAEDHAAEGTPESVAERQEELARLDAILAALPEERREVFVLFELEGLTGADWVLIDAGDVIVHVFRPEIREFYNIEKMWQTPDLEDETVH